MKIIADFVALPWPKRLYKIGGVMVGVLAIYGGCFQGGEYLIRHLNWFYAKLEWPSPPTIVNTILIMVGLGIIAFVNWPKQVVRRRATSVTTIEPLKLEDQAVKEKVAHQKRLGKWIASVLKQGESDLNFDQMRDWIHDIGATILVLLDQSDIDKFNGIRSQFVNLGYQPMMGIFPSVEPIMRKTQVEVNAFLRAIAIKYSAPLSS